MRIRLKSAIEDATLCKLSEELVTCSDKQYDLHKLADSYPLMYAVPELLEGLETVQALKKSQALFEGYAKLGAFTSKEPLLVPIEEAYGIAVFLAAFHEYMNEYEKAIRAV